MANNKNEFYNESVKRIKGMENEIENLEQQLKERVTENFDELIMGMFRHGRFNLVKLLSELSFSLGVLEGDI